MNISEHINIALEDLTTEKLTSILYEGEYDDNIRDEAFLVICARSPVVAEWDDMPTLNVPNKPKPMHPLNIPTKPSWGSSATPSNNGPLAFPNVKVGSIEKAGLNPISAALNADATQKLQTANKPAQVNQRMIGPMGGAKASTPTPTTGARTINPATAPTKKMPTSLVAPKASVAGSKVVTAKSPVTGAKSMPKAAPKAAPTVARIAPKPTSVDPNSGKGFVTATASANKAGKLSGFQNSVRGTASGKAPIFQKSGAAPSEPKKLAPQGSSQRDTQLASQGFKKF